MLPSLRTQHSGLRTSVSPSPSLIGNLIRRRPAATLLGRGVRGAGESGLFILDLHRIHSHGRGLAYGPFDGIILACRELVATAFPARSHCYDDDCHDVPNSLTLPACPWISKGRPCRRDRERKALPPTTPDPVAVGSGQPSTCRASPRWLSRSRQSTRQASG